MTTKAQAKANLQKALEFTEKVMRNPERYPERFVVIPLDLEIIEKVFSHERVRILNFLRKKGPVESLNELSEELDRDPSRVTRDLDELETAGLILRTRHGNRTRIEAQDCPIILD